MERSECGRCMRRRHGGCCGLYNAARRAKLAGGTVGITNIEFTFNMPNGTTVTPYAFAVPHSSSRRGPQRTACCARMCRCEWNVMVLAGPPAQLKIVQPSADLPLEVPIGGSLPPFRLQASRAHTTGKRKHGERSPAHL